MTTWACAAGFGVFERPKGARSPKPWPLDRVFLGKTRRRRFSAGGVLSAKRRKRVFSSKIQNSPRGPRILEESGATGVPKFPLLFAAKSYASARFFLVSCKPAPAAGWWGHVVTPRASPEVLRGLGRGVRLADLRPDVSADLDATRANGPRSAGAPAAPGEDGSALRLPRSASHGGARDLPPLSRTGDALRAKF